MRLISPLAAAVFLAALAGACSPETPQMSAEEFQRPENAAALEKALANCRFVISGDPREANCQQARAAKFALEMEEVGRVRRERALQALQAREAKDEGVTVVPATPRTSAPAVASPGRAESGVVAQDAR